MSQDNPYEAILNRSSSPRACDKPPRRPAEKSSVLAKAPRRRQIRKPPSRVLVRRLYEFETPRFTMDLKMLLGELCTKSYAAPFLTRMELHTPAISSITNPTFGLTGNLSSNAMNSRIHSLSAADESLLRAIEADRPGGRTSLWQRENAPKRDSNPAPVLRRMNYDEYSGQVSIPVRPHDRNILTSGRSALTTLTRPTRTPTSPTRASSASWELIQRSFMSLTQSLKHPDFGKASLRPVSVVPVFPDFGNCGDDLVALEFGSDANIPQDKLLEVENMLKKSVRDTKTISVSDYDGKQFVAWFTPTSSARDELENEGGSQDGTSEQPEAESSALYDWAQEYSIRARSHSKSDAPLHRGCFALTEHEGPDNKRAVTLGRIDATWKLSRRLGCLQRLCKPHLRLNSTGISKETQRKTLKKNIADVMKSS